MEDRRRRLSAPARDLSRAASASQSQTLPARPPKQPGPSGDGRRRRTQYREPQRQVLAGCGTRLPAAKLFLVHARPSFGIGERSQGLGASRVNAQQVVAPWHAAGACERSCAPPTSGGRSVINLAPPETTDDSGPSTLVIVPQHRHWGPRLPTPQWIDEPDPPSAGRGRA